MYAQTTTIVFEELPDKSLTLSIKVEHEKTDEVPFLIKIGKELIDSWFSEEDLTLLQKTITKAMKIRKDAIA